MTNKELLAAYLDGFKDCGAGTNRQTHTGLSLTAYALGWDHYLIGDDVRAVDYLSEEQIVAMIRQPSNRLGHTPTGDNDARPTPPFGPE